MINYKRIEEIVKVLVKYENPYITDITVTEAKVYSAQTITEPCITCLVYRSKEEAEERALSHISPIMYKLIFPEYYTELTNDEIIKQMCQKRYLANDKRLSIQLNLYRITEQEYYDLIEVVENSKLSNNIKKVITRSKWEDEYNNLVESSPHNHYNCIFN
jgi:hypothetical protein